MLNAMFDLLWSICNNYYLCRMLLTKLSPKKDTLSFRAVAMKLR
jgi:hypothetical protein